MTSNVTHEWTGMVVDHRTPVLIASMHFYEDRTSARRDPANVRIRGYVDSSPREVLLYIPHRQFPNVDSPSQRVPGGGAIGPLGEPFPVTFNPGSLRLFGPRVKIEEEQSDDDEVEHGPEVVNHIGFEPGWVTDADGEEIGYAHLFTIDDTDADTWIPIPDPTGFSVDDSVAFVQVMTFDDPTPVHARIATSHPVTGRPGFHFRMEEWPGTDGRHGPEEVAYVILKQGLHALDPEETRSLQVGTTEPIAYLEDEEEENWARVELDERLVHNNVVVTQSQTANGLDPIVTRQQYFGASSFDPTRGFVVRLQEAESQGEHENEEVVGYVAIGSRLGP